MEIDKTDYWQKRHLCSSAAAHGSIPALQYLRDHDSQWNETLFGSASLNDHMFVARWWEKAAMNGHVNVLQWCRENGCPWDDATCYYAANGGHLNVLQWCLESGCPWRKDECRSIADSCDHFHVVQWIDESSYPTLKDSDN